MMRRDAAGFTLLEVLVALVVLGVLLAGLAQGSQFGLDVARRQSATIAAAGDMDATDRLLRRLVAEMDPGTVTNPPLLAGASGSFAFTADLAAAAPSLGQQDADVSLGVTPDRRLVLRWTPHLHAIPLGPPPPPQEATLLSGVQRAEFSYWSAGGQWLSTWNERELPLLVRVRLVFQSGERVAWPDIVAMPVRARLNG